MSSEFFKGVKQGLGFILVMLIPLSVYAVGFHQPQEILPGTFQGDYEFNGTVEVKDNLTVSEGELSTNQINALEDEIHIEGDLIVESDSEKLIDTKTGSNVVDRGWEGDEYWQKFSDGTMMIWGKIEIGRSDDHETGESCSIAGSSGFWWGTTHSFPKDFKEQPIVIVNQWNYDSSPGTGEEYSSTNVGDVTSEEFFFHACDHSSGSTGGGFTYQAIGEWR